MTIYQKLAEARKIIRESKAQKSGHNDYSKYDYFTPEQVETLVADACEKVGAICLTSLKQDQFGYYQLLTFVELEGEKGVHFDKAPEKLEFELRTEKPSITATNDTQKMGGMDTYSERYLKMKVFQIKDNNADFDAQDNRKVSSEPKPWTKPVVPLPKSIQKKMPMKPADNMTDDAYEWPDQLDGK